jgi:TatA/E family protein of Tat protein translocase
MSCTGLFAVAAFTRCASPLAVLHSLKPNHIMNLFFHPVLANPFGPQGIFILFVLLLLFGAKKLPELAKGLGQAIREFSKAKNEISDEIMREQAPTPPKQIETPAQTAAIPQPSGTQPTSTQAAAPSHHTETHV